MSNPQRRVIIDDNAGDIQYTGGQWTLSTLVQWYQATSNFPAFVTNTTFGSLTFSFQGLSAAIIGDIPSSDSSQFASVSIDDGPFFNISYAYSAPPAYIQWYQTPTLTEGKHTINIEHLDGTAVDMVIVTVGPDTPLASHKIFVDNSDPSVKYTGNWAESNSGFRAGSLPDGLPVGNTTQQSTTPGDLMTFQFYGTSVSIYGIFSWTNIGGISATYTLDGNAEFMSYPVTAGSPEHLSADGQATNFLFYEKDNLTPNAHTLIMNITDLQNQAFSLDFITYLPSFSSFVTMPNLTTIPSESTTATATSSPTIHSDSSNDVPIGAIVGGVLGGLALLVIIGLALVCIRRRRSSTIVDRPLPVRERNEDGALHMTSISGVQRSSENISPFRISPTTPTTQAFSSSNGKSGRLPSELGYGASRVVNPSPSTTDLTSNTSLVDAPQQSLSTVLPSNTAGEDAGMIGSAEHAPGSVPPAYSL